MQLCVTIASGLLALPHYKHVKVWACGPPSFGVQYSRDQQTLLETHGNHIPCINLAWYNTEGCMDASVWASSRSTESCFCHICWACLWHLAANLCRFQLNAMNVEGMLLFVCYDKRNMSPSGNKVVLASCMWLSKHVHIAQRPAADVYPELRVIGFRARLQLFQSIMLRRSSLDLVMMCNA